MLRAGPRTICSSTRPDGCSDPPTTSQTLQACHCRLLRCRMRPPKVIWWPMVIGYQVWTLLITHGRVCQVTDTLEMGLQWAQISFLFINWSVLWNACGGLECALLFAKVRHSCLASHLVLYRGMGLCKSASGPLLAYHCHNPTSPAWDGACVPVRTSGPKYCVHDANTEQTGNTAACDRGMMTQTCLYVMDDVVGGWKDKALVELPGSRASLAHNEMDHTTCHWKSVFGLRLEYTIPHVRAIFWYRCCTVWLITKSVKPCVPPDEE